MSLYEVLGVSPTASGAQVTAAYRRLLRRYHPDTAEPTLRDSDARSERAAGETLQSVIDAYEVLHDPVRRADYDRRHAVVTSPVRPRPAANSTDFLLRVSPVSWQDGRSPLLVSDSSRAAARDDMWELIEGLLDMLDRRWTP